MFNFCWFFFITHIVVVPILINWYSKDTYGVLSKEIELVVVIVHTCRGILPSIVTLLWIYYEVWLKKWIVVFIFLFVNSLIASVVAGCLADKIFPSVFMALFQVIWVTLSVPFVAICLKKKSITVPIAPLQAIVVVKPDIATLTKLKEEQCAICLDLLIENQVSTSCHHTFHLPCILEWTYRERRCPLCNHDLNNDVVN